MTTTNTIEALTSAPPVSSSELSFAWILMLTFLALLVAKEIASEEDLKRGLRTAHSLDIGLVPLGLTIIVSVLSFLLQSP
jgi:hypothetical protein